MAAIRALAAALLLGGVAMPAAAQHLSANIQRQLPRDHVVLAAEPIAAVPGHYFYIVALASRSEARSRSGATARPLLIYERARNGHYTLSGRNDEVVLRADDGGVAGNGCDPFEDRHIAVKGAYFTVENGIGCGAHWTDYITFRFDRRSGGFLFDNSRFESWSMNRDTRPSAEGLVSDGQKVVRADLRRAVPFAKWRRRD